MAVGSQMFKSGFDLTLKFAYKPADGVTRVFPGGERAAGHNLFWRPELDRPGGTSKGFWDGMVVQEGGVQQTSWKPYLPFPPDSTVDAWLGGTPSRQPLLAT